MIVVMSLALLLAGQKEAAPAKPAAPAPKAAPAKGGKLICERQETTGSRLGAKQVCLTEAEWRVARNQSRIDIERAQNTGAKY